MGPNPLFAPLRIRASLASVKTSCTAGIYKLRYLHFSDSMNTYPSLEAKFASVQTPEK